MRYELRAHVHEGARELQLQGWPSAEAIARALRDLGDRQALGRWLRASRRTVAGRRPLVQPAGVPLVERRHPHALPEPRLTLALAASSIAAAIFVLIYLWP